MKVLLLSAYDAVSHQYWRNALKEQFSQWQWTQLALPARHFSWRVRGNSLSWGLGHREVLERGYDLVIATSMTDLATLRGLVPALSQIPTMVYFHENQFAYPVSGREKHSTVELQMLNIYTALAADRVLFNSHYNRKTFLDGAASLLRRLPDQVPRNVMTMLESCSAVLPVPLNLHSAFRGKNNAKEVMINDELDGDVLRESDPDQGEYRSNNPGNTSNNKQRMGACFTLLWNHRWEYDKAPERCVLILMELCRRQLPFRVHLLGQRFRELPVELDTLKSVLGDRLGYCGYLESREKYHQVLSESDAVLSTALHDFQGLSVLEAVLAGAVPVVPDRLAYVELFAKEFRYPSYEKDAEQEIAGVVDHIERLIRLHEKGESVSPPSVHNLTWERMRSQYQNEFSALMR